MFMETIRDAFAFIGYLGFIVALLGIGLNEILYGTWYGETEAQKRERVRKDRRKAREITDCHGLRPRNDRTGE